MHRDEKEAASSSSLGEEYCLTVHTEPNEWVCWSTAFPQYQFIDMAQVTVRKTVTQANKLYTYTLYIRFSAIR